jgi:hypothetical protein
MQEISCCSANPGRACHLHLDRQPEDLRSMLPGNHASIAAAMLWCSSVRAAVLSHSPFPLAAGVSLSDAFEDTTALPDQCLMSDLLSILAQRIQDQVQTMVKEGRWQEVTNEKREVMLHMQDVLRSCHTLLQTTQIPMNGVVNLLQHILK